MLFVLLICCHVKFVLIRMADLALGCMVSLASQMALKYHPDKNPEEGAPDIFCQIKQAYEVLGND